MSEMIELTDDELEVVAAGPISGDGDNITINNSGSNAQGSVGGLIGNLNVTNNVVIIGAANKIDFNFSGNFDDRAATPTGAHMVLIGFNMDPVEIDVLANDIDPDGDNMTIGTINGADVSPGQKDISVGKYGATVTISDDGKTLKYDPASLDYYSSDPLAVEGDTAVTASGDADATVLWEGYPNSDTFTYQAKDEHGATSSEATVNVYRGYLYCYDVGTDPVLDETSTDVGDPSLLIA